MVSIPAGYTEATFVTTVNGSPRNMTWSCGFDFADFNSRTPDQMAEDLYTLFTAAGRPYVNTNMCTGWSFLGVSIVKQMEEGPLVGAKYQTVVGSKSGTTVPNNCSVLLKKVTNTGGRRGRGRAFLPPCFNPETNFDAAGFMSAPDTALTLAPYTAAFAAAVVAGIDPVLYHQTPPYTPSLITAFQMSNQLATQRRRMRK